MDVDRHLVTGAIVLLLIQTTVFLLDLGVIDLKGHGRSFEQKVIGEIVATQQNVRRRSQDSLIWEESQSQETLRAYDAVMTLAASSAQLKLHGDIQIQLQENTLVVVEPPEESIDGTIRLRFQKGLLRSRSSGRPMTIDSGGWTVEATKGSDLRLRSLDEERVELEVVAGHVDMSHQQTGESVKVENGHRLVIDRATTTAAEPLSRDLAWSATRDQRIYTHSSIAEVELSWQGQASKILISESKEKDWTVNLEPNAKNTVLPLKVGSYLFRLQGEKGLSPSLGVNVLPAEKILYYSPLPRDRIEVGRTVDFRWSKISLASVYRIELLDSHGGRSQTLSDNLKSSSFQTKPTEEGLWYWQVEGVDDQGFRIPAYYRYPIEFLRDPLAPPQLKAPVIRSPASEGAEPKPAKSSWLNWIQHELWPTAFAASPNRKIVFSWYPVPGAEEYFIEISSTPDFQQPEVATRIEGERFEWDGYRMQIYYWRVAAGQKSGKRGLFSEPGRADLTHVNQNDAEIGPGVDLAPLVKVAKPTPPKVKKKEEPPPVAEPTKYPDPLPPPPPAPTETAMTVRRDDMSNLYRAWLGVAWMDMATEIGRELHVKQSGFSTLDMGGDINYRLDNKGSLIFHGRWTSQTWKPDVGSRWPTQSDLSELRSFTSFHYREAGTGLAYGIALDVVPLAGRETLESVGLNRKWFWGPSVEWIWEVSKFRGRHQAFLHFMSAQWGFTHLSSFDWTFSSTELLRPYLGLNVELRSLMGEPYEGTAFRLGFHFGVEW